VPPDPGGGSGAFDDIAALVIFARVVQQRSFTRAARELDTSTSAVSKRIARLEARLRTPLLTRTTRQVTPSEAGLMLYEHCLRILREVEDAELHVAGLANAPRGLLRVSAPVYFGELHVAPLLAGLVQRYPEIRLELSLNDRFVDLVAEGFDLAVRIGDVSGASLVTKRLARVAHVACAAPAYLERRGRPQHPRDLLEHDCLRYTLDPVRGSWRFKGSGGAELTVPVTGGFDSNHGGALREAAVAGLGIVRLPEFYVAEAIDSGALVRILDEFMPSDLNIQGVYPGNRMMSPKTRVALDFLAQELSARLTRCALVLRGNAGRSAAQVRHQK
jgi:DNA-binding transcriptional LysR family regulator